MTGLLDRYLGNRCTRILSACRRFTAHSPYYLRTLEKRIEGSKLTDTCIEGRTNRASAPADGRSYRYQRKRGFTLLELLVVMVIIGLLAAYVGPRYFAQLGRSEQGAAKAQIEALAKALDAYRLDTGHYPSTSVGLGALVTKPADEARWQGPYLQKAVPPDPWGRAFIYRSPGINDDFDLTSFGKDGRPGGEADNADVSFR